MRNCSCAQCTFSIAADASNGTMGEKSVHRFLAKIVVHKTTQIQLRNEVTANNRHIYNFPSPLPPFSSPSLPTRKYRIS